MKKCTRFSCTCMKFEPMPGQEAMPEAHQFCVACEHRKMVHPKREAVAIGYARVSTADVVRHADGTARKSQSTDLQVEALTSAGCIEVIKDDGLSGATTARPGLQKALAMLRQGDTLVVWKLDRLGRSLADLIRILDDLKAKGIEFRSLNEAIDTRTAIGRLMWQIIGAFAEFERECIRERVAAGQARAKAKGVRFGRKPKLSEVQLIEFARMRKEDHSIKYICQVLKIGRTCYFENAKRLPEAS